MRLSQYPSGEMTDSPETGHAVPEKLSSGFGARLNDGPESFLAGLINGGSIE